jgi:hypothetical protein
MILSPRFTGEPQPKVGYRAFAVVYFHLNPRERDVGKTRAGLRQKSQRRPDHFRRASFARKAPNMRSKKTQPSTRDEERKKSNPKDVTEPQSASNPEKPPYLNEDGLMDLNQVPDEVWRGWRRWKRLPGKEPRPAIQREKEWKPKPYRPRRRRR